MLITSISVKFVWKTFSYSQLNKDYVKTKYLFCVPYTPTYLHVNACNLSIFNGIPFILPQIIWWMYIMRSCNFLKIPTCSPHSRVIKKFYDLLGQPSHLLNDALEQIGGETFAFNVMTIRWNVWKQIQTHLSTLNLQCLWSISEGFYPASRAMRVVFNICQIRRLHLSDGKRLILNELKFEIKFRESEAENLQATYLILLDWHPSRRHWKVYIFFISRQAAWTRKLFHSIRRELREPCCGDWTHWC